MSYNVLKFLHVGSMFIATALAIGPITLLVLVLRSGDLGAIRRAFQYAESLSRAGGIAYGLGVIFGILTAINGGISLTTPWLVTAYILLGALVANNLFADHWIQSVRRDSHGPGGTESADLARWVRSAGPVLSLAAALVLSLALVFVMVVKPQAA
jgi:hypothetical protein